MAFRIGIPRVVEASINLGDVNKEAKSEGIQDIYKSFLSYCGNTLTPDQKRRAHQAWLLCRKGEVLNEELNYILSHP